MEKYNSELKHLFSPFSIKNVQIRNRMVFQPHVPYFGSIDGYPTEATKRYYIERAKGGTGLIIIESMIVHPTGLYAPGCICLYKDGIVEAFRDFPERIHQYGAKVFGQMSHCGPNTVAKPALLSYGPSAVPHPTYRTVPKELETDEIQAIVKGFGQGARKLQLAGFDGVELKFAHDGLLKAFASPLLNQRTDAYGGSYENRLRFFKEIVEEIRGQVGEDFPIGARLCIDEFVEGGIDQALGVRLAKSLEELGIDYINGDSGSAGDASMQIFPMCVPLGAGVYLASAVKKAVKIPVIAFGRVNDPVLMETILAEGHADLVGSARQFICDPETANKALEGRLDDIRHCIACNDGCIYRCKQAKPIHCIQNPATGREQKWGIGTLKKAPQAKRIMVIGGGVAGLKFAEVAARRGHCVTVYEREESMGGQINIAERLPFRAEIGEVVRYLRKQLESLNVPCITGREISIEDVRREAPDVVVAATGSHEQIPMIEGMKESAIRIVDVRTLLTHPEQAGKHVVVLDRGGHIKAPALCEYLLAMDSEVDYVTPMQAMGMDMDGMTLQHLNLRLFEQEKFSYDSLFDIESLGANSVNLRRVFGGARKTLTNVDTLVIVDHPVSENTLYRMLKQERGEVYAIGDCNAPRMIEQAIYEAEKLGRTV